MADFGALEARAKQFRREILETISGAGAGHPGGSLSAIDILTYLYYEKLNIYPADSKNEERDRFIMSKGHASPALYVVLASRGFFEKKELSSFRKLGAMLQGHVYAKVPGVELSTGSLGQGLSFANGMALAGKIKGKSFKVYCLLGDGEMQEGQVWEALMTAVHHKLDNLCIIIDANKVQQNGLVKEIKNIEPLAEKLKSFGCEVSEIDGHNMEEIAAAFAGFGKVKNKPYVIKANTIKGKGVSFMELNSKWHGKAPNKEELAAALKELL
ncbi:MAG: transketolase [Candidatus Firestonebacteria bacterium RIFOXYA2_FULL_40_8]|nr:MAG: transketolase [Candidatus Firestonebacteria bacterium RIFOXYA2_FULL_40_8]